MDRRLAIGSLILGSAAFTSRPSLAVPIVRLEEIEAIVADQRMFESYIDNMWLLRDLLVYLDARRTRSRIPEYARDRDQFRYILEQITEQRAAVLSRIRSDLTDAPDMPNIYRAAEEITEAFRIEFRSSSADEVLGNLVATFVVCNSILVIAEVGANVFCGCYPISEFLRC